MSSNTETCAPHSHTDDTFPPTLREVYHTHTLTIHFHQHWDMWTTLTHWWHIFYNTETCTPHSHTNDTFPPTLRQVHDTHTLMTAPHVACVVGLSRPWPLSDLGEAALVEDSVAHPAHQRLAPRVHAAHVTQLFRFHLHQSVSRMTRLSRSCSS